MELTGYVNTPYHRRESTATRRESCCSGRSKMPWMVGAGFGLLCIVQIAVNVSFRLYSSEFQPPVGCVNKTCNSSAGMCDDQLMDVLSERKQLRQDNEKLSQDLEKLSQDKEKLLQDKIRLAEENLQERKMSRESIVRLTSQIQRLQADTADSNTPRCPGGWQPYLSRCYWVSSKRNTWTHAWRDCQSRGGHVVILNDDLEERVVFSIGGGNQMWIGLRGKRNPSTRSWIFTWVDGSPASYVNWNNLYMLVWMSQDQSRGCGSTYSTPELPHLWYMGKCEEYHKWVCEKELIVM